MNILIQNCNCGFYLARNGVWTKKPEDAFDFGDADFAEEYSRFAQLANVQIVLRLVDGSERVVKLSKSFTAD